MATSTDLADVVREEDLSLNSVGRGLKKLSERLFQSVKQSPEADLLLIGAAGVALATDIPWLSIPLGIVSAKQYLWGWMEYGRIQEAIKSSDEPISVELLKRRFSTYYEGHCAYFGARHAINKYQRSLEEPLK